MDQCPRCHSFCYEIFYTHSICHECNYSPDLDFTNKKSNSEAATIAEVQKFLDSKRTSSLKKSNNTDKQIKTEERILYACY